MAKARKPLVGHPRVVSRQAELGPWVLDMGRSKRQCTCPWCDEVFSLFVRSLNGGGKRCPGCKAKVDPNGDAHHYANYKNRRDKMTDIWERAPEGAEYYSANSNTYYRIYRGSVHSWGDESIEWYDHDTPFNNFESPNFIKRPTTTQERKDG